jgi:hypothetical protein
MIQVASLLCRHTNVRRTGQGRMWMECLSCGRRTPGIQVTGGRHRSDVHAATPWHMRIQSRVLSKT